MSALGEEVEALSARFEEPAAPCEEGACSDGRHERACASSAKGGRRPGRWTVVRHTVQVLAFALFAMPMLAVGWNLFGRYEGGDDALPVPFDLVFAGSLSSSHIGSVNLLDPFAALQVMCASRTFDPAWLVMALPVVIAYGLVRARAFCGWACPVNLLLEIVDALRKKLGLRVRERVVPRHAKLGAAAAVLALSALVGVPLFEAVSPISALNKGLVFGSVAGVVTLVLIVTLELFWGHRVWCRALCPLGGFYEALGRVGLARVRIDHDACTKCGACLRACPADPVILEPAVSGKETAVREGDCMVCGACVDACPERALRLTVGTGASREDESGGVPSVRGGLHYEGER